MDFCGLSDVVISSITSYLTDHTEGWQHNNLLPYVLVVVIGGLDSGFSAGFTSDTSDNLTTIITEHFFL